MKKAGPVRYLFALLAMGAVAVFGGPLLDGSWHRVENSLPSFSENTYAPEVGRRDFAQAGRALGNEVSVAKPNAQLLVISVPLREFNMSAMPVRQKDPGNWASDESMRRAEQARFYEQEQSNAIEEAKRAALQDRLHEQANKLAANGL